jgi:hypothetical protein
MCEEVWVYLRLSAPRTRWNCAWTMPDRRRGGSGSQIPGMLRGKLSMSAVRIEQNPRSGVHRSLLGDNSLSALGVDVSAPARRTVAMPPGGLCDRSDEIDR